MTKRILPTPEQLRELLRYEPDIGKLFWKERPREMFTKDRLWMGWNSRCAGKQACCTSNGRYLIGRIFDANYQAHRVAWAIYYGEWPEYLIDHINCIKTDNRIANLRQATKSQNGMNRGATVANRSGLKGASWSKKAGRWEARIKRDGKAHFLGYYESAEEAHAAYCSAVYEAHGDFARVK